MFRRWRLPVAWFSAVVVLVRLGPGPNDDGVGLGTNGTPAAWLSWASTHPDEALATLAAGVAWLLLAWVAVAFLVVMGASGAGRSSRWCRRGVRLLVPRPPPPRGPPPARAPCREPRPDRSRLAAGIATACGDSRARAATRPRSSC